LLAIVLLILGFYAEFFMPVSFDSATWKAASLAEAPQDGGRLGTPIRLRMLADLQHKYNLAQMNRSEISSLLGNADFTWSTDLWNSAPPVAPGDSVVVYNLGREGLLNKGGDFWKHLRIEFSPDDRVQKVNLYDYGS